MSEPKENLLQRIHRLPFHWYHIFIFPLLIAALLIVIVGGLGQLAMAVPFKPLINGPDGQFWTIFEMSFSFITIWLIIILYCLIFKKSRPVLKAITSFCKGNTLKLFGLGLLIGGGMNLLCGLTALLHGDIHLTFDSFPVVKLLLLFFAVTIQSGAEELCCRGFVYQKLIRGYRSPLVAIILNSALFMVLHLANQGVTFLALMNILLSGIMFSLMVYFFDSCWCAVGAHTAWNYMQNIVLGLPNSGVVSVVSIFRLTAGNGRSSFAYDPQFGIEGTVISVVVLALVCIAIYYWGIKNNRKPTDVWEEQIREELLETK